MRYFVSCESKMNTERFRKSGVRWAVVSGVMIVSFLVMFQVPTPQRDEQGNIVWYGHVVSATENTTIGAVASGFLEIFFVNHSVVPTTAYAGTVHNTSSLFETWANASLDPDAAGVTYKAYANYGGFILTLKWGVAMDMVIRYRGNATNAKNATIFNANNCRIKVNASGGGCTALSSTVLTNAISYNVTTGTFIWLNAYVSIGSLNKGATYTITGIQVQFNC